MHTCNFSDLKGSEEIARWGRKSNSISHVLVDLLAIKVPSTYAARVRVVVLYTKALVQISPCSVECNSDGSE